MLRVPHINRNDIRHCKEGRESGSDLREELRIFALALLDDLSAPEVKFKTLGFHTWPDP